MPFSFLFLVISVTFGWPQAVWADPCVDTQLKSLLYAKGQTTKPITYGYEVEVSLKDNPKIVEYYRVPKFTDEQWAALTHEQKLIEARKAKEAAVKTGKNKPVVMVKTKMAPEFLSKELISEAADRLEFQSSRPLKHQEDFDSQLDWVWQEIGPGSAQGHVVFPRGGTEINTQKAANYVKHDFDISQAEALTFGYQKFLKDGTIPAKTVQHHSLGMIDETTLKKMTSKMNSEKTGQKIDEATKNTYTVAYRNDVYGKDNAGFEIRNCHMRLDCLKGKLRDVSNQVSEGFDGYVAAKDDVILSPTQLKKVPQPVQEFFKEIGVYVSESKKKYASGGAAYEVRPAFPLLDWANHPLIKALPKDEHALFVSKLEAANREYLDTLLKIKNKTSSAGQNNHISNKINEVQIALAKWGNDVELSRMLKEGKQTLLALKDKDGPEFHFINEVKGNAKDFKAYNNLIDSGVPAQKAKEVFALLHGESSYSDLIGNLQKSSKVKEVAAAVKDLDVARFKEVVSRGEESKAFLMNYSAVQPQTREVLKPILNEAGLKTSATQPGGGTLFRVMQTTDGATLDRFAQFAKKNGLEAELKTLMTTDFVQALPNTIQTEAEMGAFLRSFSSRATPEDRALLLSKITGKVKPGTAEQMGTYTVLLSQLYDDVRPMSSGSFLAKAGGKNYLLTIGGGSGPLKATELAPANVAKYEGRVAQFQKILEERNIKPLSRLEVANLAKSRPESTFIISAKEIGHQGIVVNGMVYSIAGNNGVSRVPLSTWVNNWGGSTLVELKASPEKLKNLGQIVDQQVGVQRNFAIGDGVADVNCTNFVSRALRDADVYHIPETQQAFGDAGAQIQYMTKRSKKGGAVAGIYKVKNVGTDISLTVMKVFMYGALPTYIGGVGYFVYKDKAKEAAANRLYGEFDSKWQQLREQYEKDVDLYPQRHEELEEKHHREVVDLQNWYEKESEKLR